MTGIDTGAPPFAPGARVYLATHPEDGSLAADICARDHDGAGWRVGVHAESAEGIAPYYVSAPAEHFCACPADWVEPPPIPAILGCPAADVLAVSLWRQQMAAWRGGLTLNRAEGGDG